MDILNSKSKPYEHIEDYYYLDCMEMRKKKTGEDYLLLSFSDTVKVVFGFVWDRPGEVAVRVSERSIVKIEGILKRLNDFLVIHIGWIEPAPLNEIPLRDFLWNIPDHLSPLIEKLLILIERITDPFCRSLIASFLLDREFLRAFITSPGGQWIHHAYEGGLMEHTVSVMELAFMTAERYPHMIHKDLIVTGAFLHDIGKTREFQRGNGGYKYSREGSLLGHISIGHGMVQEKIACLTGISRDLALHIEHMVLSHHGYEANGSPVRPKTPEAVALHLVDSYDVQMNHLESIKKNMNQEKEWSNFDKILRTALYMKKY